MTTTQELTNTMDACYAITGTMTRDEILGHMKKNDVRFLRLQFMDITGNNKNIEVPSSQFEKALDSTLVRVASGLT